MSANLNQQTDSKDPQFELKAGSFTLPLLRLLGTDMDAAAQQLAAKVEQAGDFFRNTPVVIDLNAVESDLEFPLLVGLMRGYGMVPVGVRGGSPEQNLAAEAMELAILGDTPARRRQTAAPAAKPKPEPVPNPIPVPPPQAPVTKVVTQPVRSGQRVYAPGGDLVLLAQVSSGAEVMADGHIHIYAPLRGRALAGVKGDRNARLFCQNLKAELVSVAGHYRISENIGPELKGKPVQIYLQEQMLHIEAI